MRCPRCYAETPSDVLCCPGCKLPTPKGRSKARAKGEKSTTTAKRRRKTAKKESKQIKPIVAIIACAATVIVFGLGGYFGMIFFADSAVVDPASPQYAIEKLRGLPSNQSGLTVDQSLEKEVEKSRQDGRLIEVEGWSVEPVEGSKYIVTYSIEEKDKQYLKAEWLADMSNGAFTPQTDLAKGVYTP